MAEEITYEVTLPNGQIVEVKGQPGQEEAAKAKANEYYLSQSHGAEPLVRFNQPTIPQAKTPVDKGINFLVDAIKSAGSGATKGVAGIASLPGLAERGITYIPGLDQGILKDLIGTDWGEQSLGKAKSGKYVFPGYEDIRRNLDSYLGAGPLLDYDPQHKINEYLQTGTEWGTGGLLAKPSMIPKTASVAGGAGLLAQSGEDVFDSELAGAGVGMASILPLAVLSNVGRSNAPRMLKEAFGKLDKTQQQVLLKNAQAMESWAKSIGVPLTGAESIGTQSMIDLLDITRQSRYGAPIVEDFISARPAQTRQAIEQSLDDLATKPTSYKKWAEKIQLLADDYLTQQRNIRTTMAQGAGYTAADMEVVSPKLVNSILKNIDEALAISKPTEPVYKNLTNLKNRLISEPASKSKIVDVSGKATTIPAMPEIRINILDGIKKELDEVLQLSYKSGAKEAKKKTVKSALSPIIKEIDDVLLSNPNFAQGRAVFQKQSELVTNVVEKNITAFNKAGIKPKAIVKLVFDPGNINAKDVRTISKILNKADPDAFPEIARMWLSNTFEGAFKPPLSGETLTGGAKYANIVFSGRGSEQRQVFMAMLDGVASSKNLTFDQHRNFKVGVERLMRVLRSTGKVPASNSATYQRQVIGEQAGQTTAGNIASFISAAPLQSTKKFLTELAKKRTMEDLAKAFTSPDSIDEIIKLAKLHPSALERMIGDTSRTYALTTARETQQELRN
jgi:hypothetical protein|tara:strand:+ start:1654 stop:3849 length:2196 start_codon:yes stop_codon:yes gene_type:complete